MCPAIRLLDELYLAKERGSISGSSTLTPTSSDAPLTIAALSILFASQHKSITLTYRVKKHISQYGLKVEPFCGALQLCDGLSGTESDREVAKGGKPCGLTNEYPGGFSLIVGEE